MQKYIEELESTNEKLSSRLRELQDRYNELNSTYQDPGWSSFGDGELSGELQFNAPGVGMMLTNEEGIISLVNEKYCQMSLYSMDELLGKPFTINVIPTERETTMANYKKFINGISAEERSVLYCKNGETLDVLVTGILLTNSENKRYKLSTFSDNTENKRFEKKIWQSLKEKEYLLQEIHHRVKNNMAVITGLLSLQADAIDKEEMKTLYRESENRVRSIAMVHEKLYQSDNFAAIDMESYIGDLHDIILAHARPVIPVQIEFQASNVELNINAAVPCGLIIHELVVNAYKHAFKNKEKGKICVTFTRNGDDYILTVEDDGIGLPEKKEQIKNNRLGMNLIHGLSKQLNADLSIESNNGTKITLHFKAQ